MEAQFIDNFSHWELNVSMAIDENRLNSNDRLWTKRELHRALSQYLNCSFSFHTFCCMWPQRLLSVFLISLDLLFGDMGSRCVRKIHNLMPPYYVASSFYHWAAASFSLWRDRWKCIYATSLHMHNLPIRCYSFYSTLLRTRQRLSLAHSCVSFRTRVSAPERWKITNIKNGIYSNFTWYI